MLPLHIKFFEDFLENEGLFSIIAGGAAVPQLLCSLRPWLLGLSLMSLMPE